MSDRYSVYDENRPHKDQIVDNLPGDSMTSREVAERMNKMQDVVDVARDVVRDARTLADGDFVIPRPVIAELMHILDVLKPKTTEQLRKERDDAHRNLMKTVDDWCEGAYMNSVDNGASVLEKARNDSAVAIQAHEASL